MNDLYFYKSDRYLLSRRTKYLARFDTDRRHSYGNNPQTRDSVAEAWRFPIIDTYAGGISKLNDPAVQDRSRDELPCAFLQLPRQFAEAEVKTTSTA